MSAEGHPPELRVHALAAVARELGAEAFRARHPDPALILMGGGGDGLDHDTGFRTLQVANDGSGTQTSLGVHRDAPVWWVRKRGSTFPDKITLGRSSNNDIAIGDPNVSKLHGYLCREGDTWTMVDAESRNGTSVEDRPLVPLEARALDDTTVICLGGKVRLMFCLPESLAPVMELALGGK